MQLDNISDRNFSLNQGQFPARDYVSPGLKTIKPDTCFPHMIVGDTHTCGWRYLRREIPHNWYVDRRCQSIGFLSRDEAHILYNNALQFAGKRALEIGCWMGWSACHLALAGVNLDVIDPLLSRSPNQESTIGSLESASKTFGTFGKEVTLMAGYSPQKVDELAAQKQRRWSLIFIDGNHDAPYPLNDAITCEKYAEPDAMILFHDLASPDVAQGLDYLRDRGWNTMIYQTMQIMGVAWRGNVTPVEHIPDPNVDWQMPEHLRQYVVSGSGKITGSSIHEEEFQAILSLIRPFTLLSDRRLFSLYSLTKQACSSDRPGNIVECGSYKGGAAALMAAVVKRYSQRSRYVYACDTFEGMPDPTEVDRHNGIPANNTGFGVGTLKAPIEENLTKVCQILDVMGIVKPVKGLFAETLPIHKQEIGDIVLLHADGDWYESTMDIFNNLYDRVITGGAIQIDDYGHWEGCRKAVHDFEHLHGQSFDLQKIDYTGVWFFKK
ncbi:class I SAM-dependent methyltransferase [Pseudanabaena sp. PCC 6802]|uniref:class I SAM-dependent methyltransferase n=1 Tax=Pseudanabaena sp. PCC 6802 TaxID=118173 RepID=UPI00034B5E51|nr:TylF/MycF/NovP-related O-methyltransferase [Pseudanabaena sp. PCC 6802]